MKGTRQFPQCGFSATVVQILDGLVPEYTTVNVLADPAIRQGIKDFSSWPTIPQLYAGGEFIGGCDIVQELFASGDLAAKLGGTAEPVEPPTITVTPAAAEKLKAALAEAEPGDSLHLSVDAGFAHGLGIGPSVPTDIAVETEGLTVHVDPASARRAQGIRIDYVSDGEGGFKIDNPNAPAEIIDIDPADLRAKLDAGEVKEFYDVRGTSERARASIPDAQPLDDATIKRLESLDHNTPLAFHCHHGGRSRRMAEHFRDLGFREVYNLKGGIDRWSMEIDTSIPRY